MNEKIMKIALIEAQKAFELNEIPIGAVITLNDKIIAKAHNMKNIKNDATQHAEIIAISKASKKIGNWRLLNCSIYVTMIPCPMCASAINQSRISKVVYGCVPNYINKKMIHDILNDNNYGNKVEIVEKILENDSKQLLSTFFNKLR